MTELPKPPSRWRAFLLGLIPLIGATAIVLLANREFAELKAHRDELEIENKHLAIQLGKCRGKNGENQILTKAHMEEDQVLSDMADKCEDKVVYERRRAEFWYKWQHSKNGPHCFRALRLVEQYEKDTQLCKGPIASAYGDDVVPSLRWWCTVRMETIERNTNKVEAKD